MISQNTLSQAIKIITNEIGIKKAKKLLKRLKEETKGNNSYNKTIDALYNSICLQKENK